MLLVIPIGIPLALALFMKRAAQHARIEVRSDYEAADDAHPPRGGLADQRYMSEDTIGSLVADDAFAARLGMSIRYQCMIFNYTESCYYWDVVDMCAFTASRALAVLPRSGSRNLTAMSLRVTLRCMM
eukprot:COSAG01_NODE_5808_length_4021_cov_1.614482_6_plen_128_part_00